MAKKEKIAIQKDKTMEPIDNELDEAMGLLDAANRQIGDLLTSLDAAPPTSSGAVEVPEATAEAAAPAEGEAALESASAVEANAEPKEQAEEETESKE